MRRSRNLTSSERWELALFMGMLVVGCVCLTALVSGKGLPRLFAFTTQPELPPLQIDRPPVTLTPAAPQPSLTAPVAPAPRAPATVNVDFPLLQPLPPVKKSAPDIRFYNGVAYRYAKTVKLRVTAYAPDIRCTWPYPGTTTASGLSVKTNHGNLVAADPRVIPMHSLVVVPGYAGGAAVPVLDTGGAIKGSRLDVLLPTFDQAKVWGTRLENVRIYLPVD